MYWKRYLSPILCFSFGPWWNYNLFLDIKNGGWRFWYYGLWYNMFLFYSLKWFLSVPQWYDINNQHFFLDKNWYRFSFKHILKEWMCSIVLGYWSRATEHFKIITASRGKYSDLLIAKTLIVIYNYISESFIQINANSCLPFSAHLAFYIYI